MRKLGGCDHRWDTCDELAKLFAFGLKIQFLGIFSADLPRFLVYELKHEHDKLAKYVHQRTLCDA